MEAVRQAGANDYDVRQLYADASVPVESVIEALRNLALNVTLDARERARLQRAIGRQARIRRTPELSFRPDEVISQAARVEQILRDLGDDADQPAGERAREGGTGTP